MLRSRNRRRAGTAAGLVVALTMTTIATAHAVGAHQSLPDPLPTPKEGAAIEGYSPDQSQFFCRSTVLPGVRAFERRVLKHYPVSHSSGDMRGCSVGGTSEHKDGRAWDWGVDHRVAAQRAAGKSMLHWLFATDSHGNHNAMFRRLGLMYVIWNKKIWGAWSQHWEPYSCSGPTLCHVDHMHFSFGWAGAEKKTSYWTHDVSPVLEPPLPVLAKLHAHRALRVSARTGTAAAMWLLRAESTYRVTAHGLWRTGDGRRSRADARCVKTPAGWVPNPAGGLTVGGDQLHLWDQQWAPVHDTGNGCDTRTHRYRLVIHQLVSSTVTAQLPADNRSDDHGSIKVRFFRSA
ncbi:MAG: hypothetical protein JO246_01550 [Frankiaceae bacterium]|nr:hypothetical protein [Frankiaceae bacterium]MBV9872075.1 hypothetical protein [Frankiaceae bacterium]